MTTVLAVDDSPSMRMLLQGTLAEAGYNVTLAEDGQHALDLSRDKRYDVVLSDVNMPRLDGIGLVSALRRNPDYRFVPILIITTETSQEIKSRARAAGATGWIVKPFDPDRLIDALNRVVR